MKLNTINNEYSFCKNYFSEGEEILWQGRPERENKEESSVLNVFGIIFLGFGVLWSTVAAFFLGFLALLGIPFVAMGLYLLVFKKMILQSTRYVITNKKIYRKQLGRVSVKRILEISDIKVQSFGGGYGCIYFGKDDENEGKKFSFSSFDIIEGVSNVSNVHKIIYEAARNL